MLAVLGVIGIVELILRISAGSLSGDVRHIQEMPAIILSLSQQPPPRLMFVGNSLAGEGIDLDVIRSGLSEEIDAAVSVGGLFPDASTQLSWYYIIKNMVLQEPAPEVVVFGIADFTVKDAADPRIRSLAMDYARVGDIPELFSRYLKSFDERGEFLTASALHSYATQERVKKRILDAIIPGYRAGLRALVRMGSLHSEERETESMQRPTYRKVADLIEMASTHGMHSVFVGMPLVENWNLDTMLVSTIVEHGGTFIDARSLANLDENDFRDGFHLNADGRAKLSQVLVTRLKTVSEVSRAATNRVQ